MKKIFLIFRWIIGVLFIFSGLIKANDPSGLSYKMQEFFEAWGTTQFNPLSLYLSFAMNTFEIVAGVAILVGWRYKLTLKLLLLLIIFFTFLTGYALLSGKIATCGCFGDCLPLTPLQSFLKDIFLLILILVLLIFKNHYETKNIIAFRFVLSSFLFTIILQWYVLLHLPFLDCLPYKINKDIIKQMEMPANAIPDKVAIFFKYQKNGKIIEFEQTHFPEDFDNSYTFIERKDKVIEKGNGLKAAISDFALKNSNGVDTTNAIFNLAGKYMLVFSLYTDKYTHWDNLLSKLKQKNMPYFIVTADVETAKNILPNEPILQADATNIKTAARVNPTVFLMDKSIIKNKKAASDVAGL